MLTLYKKELNYYLNNPIGYIIIVLFAAFANFLFIKDIFVIGSASMRAFFGIIPWLFLVFIPALSMRALAEEKRMNTLETLLTLPISETQIVISKFLALLSIIGVGLVLTLGLPVSLSLLTKLYLPEVLVGYLGVVLVGALYLSLSLYFSSQTKNQVIAFLFAAVVLFFLTVASSDFSASVLPKFILDTVSYFTPLYHLDNFIKGVIDLRSVLYFLSFTILFLFLTIIDLEKRD